MAKHSILFVDDEPKVTEALKRVLRQEPYEVLCARSADEGLKILDSHDIDVVVSDERMPGMSGSEFLALVRAKHPLTVRIILSGQASLDAAIRAINEGEVYRLITKPCNDLDLIVTIRQALQHRALAVMSRKLLREYRMQASVLRSIEVAHPGIGRIDTDPEGAILIEAVEGDVAELLKQIEQEVENSSLAARAV